MILWRCAYHFLKILSRRFLVALLSRQTLTTCIGCTDLIDLRVLPYTDINMKVWCEQGTRLCLLLGRSSMGEPVTRQHARQLRSAAIVLKHAPVPPPFPYSTSGHSRRFMARHVSRLAGLCSNNHMARGETRMQDRVLYTPLIADIFLCHRFR